MKKTNGVAKIHTCRKQKHLKKNGGRFETRIAKTCNNTDWLKQNHKGWDTVRSYGVIERIIEIKGKITKETHYYISSLEDLTPEKLLYYTRKEWSVEAMHWKLDVFFKEDTCRFRTKDGQILMNILRKTALNLLSLYKANTLSSSSTAHIMRTFLNNPSLLLQLCY